MSEYLKPQSPIKYKKDGTYIYPLTTADQVLLNDNTRLNAALDDINTKIDNLDFGDISIEGLDNMVQINLDGAVEGEANLVNAGTLNGKTEDMLRVLDSTKLGGKLAENYATRDFVTTKIAEAQLGNDGSGDSIDLTGFATKDDITNAILAVDFPVDSVNGKTGAVQLTATDVGAAPSHNLLDNSDFTNPVNQLGTITKTIGTDLVYFMDRWQGKRCTLSLGENGITANWDGANGSNGYIHQSVVGNFAKGDIYTLSAEINGDVFCGALTLGESGDSVSITLKDGIVLSLAWSNIGKIYAYVYFTKQSVIKYVALYKGGYTSETLPKYQPKGYANELLICRQYNHNTGEYTGIPSIVNDFDTTAEGYVADARALKTLNDRFNVDLLWRNASPTSSFTNQTIQISGYSYNLFLIRYKLNASYSKYAMDICLKGDYGWLSVVMGSAGTAGSDAVMVWRELAINSGSIVFYNAYKSGKSLDNEPTQDDGWVVPYEIYGIYGGINA